MHTLLLYRYFNQEGVIQSYDNATDQVIIKLTDRQLEKGDICAS